MSKPTPVELANDHLADNLNGRSPHHAFIEQQIPAWLVRGAAADRAAYFEHLRASAASMRAAAAVYGALRSPVEFCKPALEQRLRDQFGLDIDTAQYDLLRLTLTTPMFTEQMQASLQRYKVERHTLLDLALQNFEPREAEAQGLATYAFILPTSKSLEPCEWVLTDAQVRAFRDRQPFKARLNGQQFAQLCRDLDLGAGYQAHIASVLERNPSSRTLAVLQKKETDQFRFQALAALMRGAISPSAFAMLLSGLGQGNPHWDRTPVRVKRLELLHTLTQEGTRFGGAFLAERTQGDSRLVLCLPGAGDEMFQEFPSMASLTSWLRLWLRSAPAHAFLARWVPYRERRAFFVRLDNTLNPKPLLGDHQAPGPRDDNADIGLQTFAISGSMPAFILKERLDKIVADGEALVVSTGDADQKQRDEHFATLVAEGMLLANIAALFIPGVGEILGVTFALDILKDVFIAVDDWTHGQTEDAIGHIKSVVENIAFAAGLTLVHQGVVRSGFIEQLVPVRHGPEGERLWNPNLAPYRRPGVLPKDLLPDGEGIFWYNGRAHVRIDGLDYHAAPAEGTTRWRLEHAKGSGKYGPGLEHNGEGAWRHVHEAILDWHGSQLRHRWGPAVEGRSHFELVDIQAISGVSTERMRQAFFEREPMPALFADTLARFDLYAGHEVGEVGEVGDLGKRERFEAFYRSQQPPVSPAVAILLRDFPALPNNLAQALIDGATDVERMMIAERQRLPLRLAVQAREELREVRIARACEGLFLPGIANEDSQRLAVRLLGDLPAWSGQYRIELRDETPGGALLAAVGPEQATQRLIRRDGQAFQLFDEQQRPLTGATRLHACLLAALPEADRLATGLPEGDASGLLGQLQSQALEARGRVAELLELRPRQSWFKAPTTAMGALGYPMSGRGLGRWHPTSRLRQLYPGLRDAEFDVLKTELRLKHGSLSVAAEVLEQEWAVLSTSLDAWATLPDRYINAEGIEVLAAQESRRMVALRIKAAWRRETPIRRGAGYVLGHQLILDGLMVGRLPSLVGRFEHITSLSFTAMALSSDPSEFLFNFPNARALSLAGNRLGGVPAAVSEMRDLRFLDLGNNQLVGYHGMFAPLRGHPSVRELLFDRNQVQVPTQAFRDLATLPALERLYLSHNNMTLDAEALEALAVQAAHLRVLDAGRNRITLDNRGATALGRMVHLRELLLDHNPLRQLPSLAPFTDLQGLNLSGCGLDTWPEGLLELMDARPNVQLRMIDLSHNDIASIPSLRRTLFAQSRVRPFGRLRYRLSLIGNPLTPGSVRALRAAGFRVAQMPSPEVPRLPLASTDWLEGCPPSLRTLVEHARAESDTTELVHALDRVVETADYRADTQGVRARMWEVARSALQDQPAAGVLDLREQLCMIASDALGTCGDGVSLVLNEFENTVRAWRCATEALDGPLGLQRPLVLESERLLRLALVDETAIRISQKRLNRQQALRDRVAPAELPELDPLDEIDDHLLLTAVDEAEIRLVMRRELAGWLQLPAQPAQMLYAEHVTPGTLNRVRHAVVHQATQWVLVDWLTEQRYWAYYLKAVHAEAFQASAQKWASAGELLEDVFAGEHTDIEPQALPAPAMEVLQRAAPARQWEERGAPGPALDEQAYRTAYEGLMAARQKAEAQAIKDLTRTTVDEYSSLPPLDEV